MSEPSNALIGVRVIIKDSGTTGTITALDEDKKELTILLEGGLVEYVPANGVKKAPAPTLKPESAMTKKDLAEYETAIRTQKTGAMDPIEYKQFQIQAKDIISSEAAPKSFTNPLQILMAFQVGKEMGMSPMESLHSLYIVNGAINIWGKAVTRRLREHGWAIQFKNEDGTDTCTATITHRETGEEITETYTFEEAKKSGYTIDNSGKLKVGWREGINRKLKLRYGVLSLIIKSYIPEVLGSAVGIAEVDMDSPHGQAQVMMSARQRIEAGLRHKKQKGEKIVDTKAAEKVEEGEPINAN